MLSRVVGFLTCLALIALPSEVRAGLYYSGEPIAELPSQWRGFLTDLRALRYIAVKPTAALPASPMRRQYEDAANKLREASQSRRLTADEQADLGALLIRLGETEPALRVLREAQREHPQHFRIAANLGTAWQLSGDLDRAAEALREAVRLAPGKHQRMEEFHLKLVQLRQRQTRNSQALDDLFGIRYIGESGGFEPGKLAAAERKKLPSDAVAIVQQLAIWLPSDGKLLWQLGELANAHADIKTAAEIYESCVGQFALNSATLREHRSLVREALASGGRQPPGTPSTPAASKAEHESHAGRLAAKSSRPLASKRFDASTLPAVTKDGVNPLPWALLLETSMGRVFRPGFAKYLQELDGHQVSLTGFIQPLTDDVEWTSCMLIEYPTGCWYCEMPEITGIILVELPEDKSMTYTRNMVKVTGKLSLNATDPENFLYTIKEARVGEAD